MRELLRSVIINEFHGWTGNAVLRLANGQVWQQSAYLYEYHYAHRPEARLVDNGGETLLYVDGLTQPAVVRRVSVVEEGIITSKFTGFSRDARFTFQNGRTWVPAEYKYAYHYAHRPDAMVVDGVNGLELVVSGMSETLRVRRA